MKVNNFKIDTDFCPYNITLQAKDSEIITDFLEASEEEVNPKNPCGPSSEACVNIYSFLNNDDSIKVHTIKIPIYFGKLVIIKVKKISEINEKFGFNNTEDYASISFHRKNKKGNSKYYIVLKEKTSNSIIAHEVVHLVNYIFIQNGIELDRYNDEVQAYLMGWLVDQIQKYK